MSEGRATLEKIAPTVEEAIADGLEELGLSADDVDVEILDDGGRGLFGLRNRQARVRLTVRGAGAESGAYPPADEQDIQERVAAPALPPDDDTQNLMDIASATVTELLEHMSVRAEVGAHVGEVDPDDTRQDPPVVIDISGDDLSILIGRRAETLNALQYLTRLIVGKELGRSVHLIVDVEGYRQRRERSLRRLAQRMASQAIRAGRTQTLEPMSPAERRIIHLELRDNDEVNTRSIGEEPRRKVTIIPV